MLTAVSWTIFSAAISSVSFAIGASTPSLELVRHLQAIAIQSVPSPAVVIPEGFFLMGTVRIDDDPYGPATQFDDTELPRQRIWLDSYRIDRDEVSLGEYLGFLHDQRLHPSEGLQKLIWHVITVHSVSDEILARWPALYVTWKEADEFCRSRDKHLPTEAQWEKAARGSDGLTFPWGGAPPESKLAMFGQHHVHEIPILAAVDTGDEGKSPYGLHHMAGNIGEWVQDWFGFDYYAYIPERNPLGPTSGRYKGVRGGSWKSKPNMLRSATRGGAAPDQRSPTIGFRCAGLLSK
jgi:iron(II)-dependent oxidoreductase